MQINKKDQDIAASQRRLEDEGSITAKLQKTLKELQGKVEISEEVRSSRTFEKPLDFIQFLIVGTRS